MSRDEKIRILSEMLIREGALKIEIFGSFARGENDQNSDIDIIVKFKETKSLLELARIERVISEKVGAKLDLQTERSLSPYIAGVIENEKIRVLP